MGLRAKCERETEREVRFESWRKLVVAASDGASNGWWQCQWWPVVGLVVTLEKGEQKKTTMEARICEKSS